MSRAFYLAPAEVVNFRGCVHPWVSTAPVGLWWPQNGPRLPISCGGAVRLPDPLFSVQENVVTFQVQDFHVV